LLRLSSKLLSSERQNVPEGLRPPSPRTTDPIIELEPAAFQFDEAAPTRLHARIGAVRRLGY